MLYSIRNKNILISYTFSQTISIQYCLISYVLAGARDNDMFLAVDHGGKTTIARCLQTGI